MAINRTTLIGAGCVLIAASCWAGGRLLDIPLATQFGLIGLVSIVIWQACEPFAETAQWVGHRYRIPGSVRGATLDAVASSLPELFTGIFFVLYYDDFASTVATCAGSAVYNMLLIPAVCALAISFVRPENPVIRISPDVLTRDGAWFLISELVLLYCLFTHRMTWVAGVVFFALYGGYLIHLYRDTRVYRSGKGRELRRQESEQPPDTVCLFGGLARMRLTPIRAVLVLGVSTAVTAGACYVLAGSCEGIAAALNVPTFFVAVIIAAAASSVPDTMLSLGAALRGDDSGAVSNAFGSNTFDVNICLAVPVLLYAVREGGRDIPWSGESELIWLGILLWILSAATIALMRHRHSLGRRKALILCGMYALFIAYAVAGSITAK